jgi:hypothetical protein
MPLIELHLAQAWTLFLCQRSHRWAAQGSFVERIGLFVGLRFPDDWRLILHFVFLLIAFFFLVIIVVRVSRRHQVVRLCRLGTQAETGEVARDWDWYRAAYLERASLKEHPTLRPAVHGRYRDRGRCGEMSATIR